MPSVRRMFLLVHRSNPFSSGFGLRPFGLLLEPRSGLQSSGLRDDEGRVGAGELQVV